MELHGEGSNFGKDPANKTSTKIEQAAGNEPPLQVSI